MEAIDRRELLRRSTIGALAQMMAAICPLDKNRCWPLAELAYKNLRPKDSEIILLSGKLEGGQIGSDNVWEWLGRALLSTDNGSEITVMVKFDDRR